MSGTQRSWRVTRTKHPASASRQRTAEKGGRVEAPWLFLIQRAGQAPGDPPPEPTVNAAEVGLEDWARRAWDVRAWVLAILFVLGLAAPASADTPARITSVRFGGTPERTRVVVDSDTPLKYHVFLLAAGTQRVVIDLPKVRWSIDGLTAESGSGKGSGVVAGYRYAQNTATTPLPRAPPGGPLPRSLRKGRGRRPGSRASPGCRMGYRLQPSRLGQVSARTNAAPAKARRRPKWRRERGDCA